MLWVLFMAGGGRKLSLFLFGSPLSQVPWRRLQKAPVLASISFLCVGLSTARANRHCFPKGPLSLSSDDQRAVQEFSTCWQVSSENLIVDWNRAGALPGPHWSLPLLYHRGPGETFSSHFPEEQTGAEHRSSVSNFREGVRTLGSQTHTLRLASFESSKHVSCGPKHDCL